MNYSQTAAATALATGLLLSLDAVAAVGEMGTGVPGFNSYSAATGTPSLVIYSLSPATIPIPSECSYVVLSLATLGPEAYKIAAATLLAAKLADKPVRLYAHASRDGGCGADFISLN